MVLLWLLLLLLWDFCFCCCCGFEWLGLFLVEMVESIWDGGVKRGGGGVRGCLIDFGKS